MRPLSSLISPRKPPAGRLPEAPRHGTEKGSPQPKPARKRCLNEAAHKLDR
jgi:hypothetical protein